MVVASHPVVMVSPVVVVYSCHLWVVVLEIVGLWMFPLPSSWIACYYSICLSLICVLEIGHGELDFKCLSESFD